MPTFDDYVSTFQRLFVIEDVEAWCPAVRSAAAIRTGAKHLLQLRNLIREKNKDEKQMPLREPDLLIVLTGGEMAYTREDGVKVIPLATLRD